MSAAATRPRSTSWPPTNSCDRLPVRVAGRVEQHDRHRQALAGLGQRQQLERLVERAEPAGQADEALALLDQHQLAGEEVLHADVLVVAGDHRVGALLERQADRHADRLARARRPPSPACMIPGPAPVTTIQPCVGQLGGDVAGLHVQRVGHLRAGRAEDGHLRHVVERREHLERLAHLLQRGAGDLQVERARAGPPSRANADCDELLAPSRRLRPRSMRSRATSVDGRSRFTARSSVAFASRAPSSSSKLFWKLATPFALERGADVVEVDADVGEALPRRLRLVDVGVDSAGQVPVVGERLDRRVGQAC